MAKFFHKKLDKLLTSAGDILYIAELQGMMGGELQFLCMTAPENDRESIRFTAASEMMFDLMTGKDEEIDESVIFYAGWTGLDRIPAGYEEAVGELLAMIGNAYGVQF